MSASQRPLSPHLQVYRWGWTMSLSIAHRMTGLVLSFGAGLLALWLFALAAGPENYRLAQAFIESWIGTLVLIFWSLAFFYHLCNGIRHLCWDAGWGFGLPTARVSGGLVIAGAILLTVACWIWVWATPGPGA